MFTTVIILQLVPCFLVAAGVRADTSIPVLELDSIDDEFESELRDFHLYRVTPAEGVVISKTDLLGKSRLSDGEFTVTEARATFPHTEYTTKVKWTKSRRARQVAGSVDIRNKKSIEQGNEDASLPNQLPSDNHDDDGSGDAQSDIGPIPEMPLIQQGEIKLIPESGYRPSSTIPKPRTNLAAVESSKAVESVAKADYIEGDNFEAISAEDGESLDVGHSLSVAIENVKNPETVENPQNEETDEFNSFEGEVRMAIGSKGRENVASDYKVEGSDQPGSLLPSGRSLDDTSNLSAQTGQVSNDTSFSVSSSDNVKGNLVSKDYPRQSKNLVAAPLPTKRPKSNGSTFPLLGDGETVRVMKDNIAVLLGMILGVPAFIISCYMINHRRRRTGSMDITPVTSESGKQKMSSKQHESRTVTCRTENELSSCPCET